MPIINNKSNSINIKNGNESTMTEELIDEVKVTEIAEKKEVKKRKSNIFLYAIFSVIIGISLSIGSYYLYKNTNISSFTSEKFDISLHLKKLTKTTSLYTLSRKEFETNFVSLQEAQKIGNTTVLTALEIVINKNKKDMINYKNQLISLLLELNKIYLKNPKDIKKQFEDLLTKETVEDNKETIKALKLGFSVLETLPKDGDLSKYISDRIDGQF